MVRGSAASTHKAAMPSAASLQRPLQNRLRKQQGRRGLGRRRGAGQLAGVAEDAEVNVVSLRSAARRNKTSNKQECKTQEPSRSSNRSPDAILDL